MSDDKLIRLSDAITALRSADLPFGYGHAAEVIRALPAVQVGADAGLLLEAYKLVLMLHRMMDKHGLTDGVSALTSIADRIVAAHPEFPGLCALRGTAIADRAEAALAEAMKNRDAVIAARDMMGRLWAQEKDRADRAEAALAAQIEAGPIAWRWESCANSQGWNTRYGCEKPVPSDYITDIVPLYAAQPHDLAALDRLLADAREQVALGMVDVMATAAKEAREKALRDAAKKAWGVEDGDRWTRACAQESILALIEEGK